MNYLEQINVFWILDAEHSFNGNESRLYFYLLKLSNSLYWKNPFSNADRYTATMVGISVNTLKTCRNRLQQAGLIHFKPGGNGCRDKCLYEIREASKVISKVVERVSNYDTKREGRYQGLTSNSQPNPQLNPIPNAENVDDNNKAKPNQKKQEMVPTAPAQKNNRVKKEGKEAGEKEKYWQPLVHVWKSFVAVQFKEEPTFDGKDQRLFKLLIEKLKRKVEAKGVQWTEPSARDALHTFLTAAYRDEWLKKNFLLSNLEKQFDKVMQNETGRQHTLNAGAPLNLEAELQKQYQLFLEGRAKWQSFHPTLYNYLMEKGNIRLPLEKCNAVLERAIVFRMEQLKGSNEGRELRVLEAYKKNEKEGMANDKAYLDRLYNKLALLATFYMLKEQNINDLKIY